MLLGAKGNNIGMGVGAVATKKVVIEVEVPEGAEEDFVETLRKRAWELYLTYKWLRLPEADERIVEELAREAEKRASMEKVG